MIHIHEPNPLIRTQGKLHPNGWKQREKSNKDNAASSVAAVESVLYITVFEIMDGQEVAVTDIHCAYLHTVLL